MEDKAIFLLLKRLVANDSHILLKLDHLGIVRESTLGRRDAWSWTSYSYYQKLLKGKSVREFFELPDSPPGALAHRLKSAEEALDVEQLYHQESMFPSRNLFEGYEKFYDFYSALPHSVLFLTEIPRLGLIGIIRFAQMENVIDHFRHHPLIILGSDDRIQAMNRCFLDYFRGGKAGAASILGGKAQDLMSKSPLSTLIGDTDQLAGLRNEKWEPAFAIDFQNAGRRQVQEQLNLENLQKKAGGYSWNSSEKDGPFLPLRQPIDTERLDFRISLSFESEQPLPPAVILNGTEDYQDVFPDYNGYLLGPDPDGSLFQIKKEGHIVHTRPFSERLSRGVNHVEIIKRGVCLAYFLNGRLVTGYRDPAIYTHPRSLQYFLSRGKGEIRLKALALHTLPSSESFFHGFNEVSLTCGADNAFYYLPLVDDVFYQKGVLHYAFIMYDISLLKKNIALLQESQKKVSRERDRYKAMALGAPSAGMPLVGESPALLQIKKEAERAAAAPVTVLIEGETGSGKEVLARYVHEHSKYKDGPFVKVDSSAIPQTLLESELFGVEKGAFTGAAESRPGKLEAANGGTLFLDELSNLTSGTQAKLLQFLQDFTLTRLGSTKAIKVNTRVIAATNIPLKQLVEEGRFREDLYYRITAVRFSVPPLRDRREDISLLAAHFLRIFNERFSRPLKGFAPAAYRKLLAHDWPGNIRELENVVQKAVLFCDKDVIGPEQIELPDARERENGKMKETSIPRGDPRMMTREHLLELLRRNNNIIERAAKDGKIARATFFNKLKKFGSWELASRSTESWAVASWRRSIRSVGEHSFCLCGVSVRYSRGTRPMDPSDPRHGT
jgi:DNA-binding NtrC family response regulator